MVIGRPDVSYLGGVTSRIGLVAEIPDPIPSLRFKNGNRPESKKSGKNPTEIAEN